MQLVESSVVIRIWSNHHSLADTRIRFNLMLNYIENYDTFDEKDKIM
jgi:hypothetical protein